MVLCLHVSVCLCVYVFVCIHMHIGSPVYGGQSSVLEEGEMEGRKGRKEESRGGRQKGGEKLRTFHKHSSDQQAAR